jgi:hypothetical protein
MRECAVTFIITLVRCSNNGRITTPNIHCNVLAFKGYTHIKYITVVRLHCLGCYSYAMIGHDSQSHTDRGDLLQSRPDNQNTVHHAAKYRQPTKYHYLTNKRMQHPILNPTIWLLCQTEKVNQSSQTSFSLRTQLVDSWVQDAGGKWG